MSLDSEELKILKTTYQTLYTTLTELETLTNSLISYKAEVDTVGDKLALDNLKVIVNYTKSFDSFVSDYETIRDLQTIIDTYEIRSIFG